LTFEDALQSLRDDTLSWLETAVTYSSHTMKWRADLSTVVGL